ncbi:MAG: TOTE conflict system archaeo-eukaryotic primase domain-containing protein [Egibacteraceae bacterium]
MSDNVADRLAAALAKLGELRAENARLRGLLGLDGRPAPVAVQALEPTLFVEEPAPPPTAVNADSSRQAKLALFRALFAGRDDVYAVRWESTRTGKAGWSPAVRGGWSGADKRSRRYLPLTDEVLARHLAGHETVGLYPLLRDDTCRLLACDFDGASWAPDALAYADACSAAGVPAALERSRSGDGAHVWILFSGAVAASAARALGASLLRAAMAARMELDLASYDRFFPAQDFLPKGSFGNLIALPLQGRCRQRGTTVFLDPATLQPEPDQWAFLSGLRLLPPQDVEAMVTALRPLQAGPTATSLWPRDGPAAPPRIRAELGAMLALERFGLPPALVSALKHLASLHNPKFHEKQALRLSTWGTPRLLRSYVETLDRLMLPRGLLGAVERLVAQAGGSLVITDQRPAPSPIRLRFAETLTLEQQVAVDDLAVHDHGVLVAPPGMGKTVMACALIARHARPTLVIVDRKPLLDQWRARLRDHLGLTVEEIGQIGGGAAAPVRRCRCGDGPEPGPP